MNSDEGARLTGLKDYRKQSELLLQMGAKNVVVKLGAGGSYFKNREVECRANPYTVKIEDPTGAGDSFNGGLIYGLVHKWDLKKSLLFANIVGASAVTKLGCTTVIYELPRLLDILSDFGIEDADDYHR